MSSYIFIDENNCAIGKITDGEIREIKFFDKDINNIYRSRIVNKNSALNGYFVEYKKGINLYLNSSIDYKIGDTVIVEYVREPSNKKLGLASENFKIENDNYYIKRYPIKSKPILKDSGTYNREDYNNLLNLKKNLLKEINFNPTPKLLFSNSFKDKYIKINEDLEVKYICIRNNKIFADLFSSILEKEITYKDYSIIIDELETLTVIDVNTNKAKSKNNKESFFININLELIEFIIKIIKLRNIGGMIVIDFLRVQDKNIIEEEFIKQSKSMGLQCDIYGFSNMGLFELTIKRRGESLLRELTNRNIISN